MRTITKLLLSETLIATVAFTIVNHNKPTYNDGPRKFESIHTDRFCDVDSALPLATGRIRTPCSSALFTSKDQDVNDLFSAYMAQRRDQPLSSTFHAENGNSESHVNEENQYDSQSQPQSAETSKKISTVGQRLKQILSNANEGSLVQPISLTPKKPAVSSQSQMAGNSATMPPNPPSLLPESDFESINQSLETFTLEMQAKLNQLRTSEGENDVLSQVMREQRDLALKQLTEKEQLESFQQYEKNLKKEIEESSSKIDFNRVIEDDALVQQIIKEAEEGRKATEKQEQQYLQLKEYEESLRKDLRKKELDNRLSNDVLVNSSVVKPFVPGDGSDGQLMNKSFEEVQLELLEDLLEKRNRAAKEGGFDDEDIYLTDNIEEGIEELRRQVERQNSSTQASTKPESLKEWQMYRAIATKLANKKKSGENMNAIEASDASPNGLSEDYDEIQNKLSAWKEFQKKEQEMREKSGLTIKYKLPFEWSDKPDVNDKGQKTKKVKPIDREKAEKARSELDKLALDVLINLMDKTVDPERKEKLRREVEALKESIQVRQENLKRRIPEVEKKKKVSPVTISEILSPTNSKKQATKIDEVEQEITDTIDYYEEDDFEDDSYIEDEFQYEVPPPPDSDFFRDVTEEQSSSPESRSLDNYVDDEEEQEDDDDSAIPSLGTLEQQKFRLMVARSGVRTVEEQNELKRKWEEFQEAENKMREISGLSAGIQEDRAVKMETLASKVNYDVNTLFKDDGDIDFDKILSSIGTRPTRKGKITSDNQSTIKGGNQPPATTVSDARTIASATTTANQSNETKTTVQPVKVTESFTSEEKTSKDEEEDVKIVQREEVSGSGSLTFGDDTKREAERKFLSSQFSGFEKRKSDLLEYNMLSVSQIDSLIGLKSSPYSSGVSPYLAKINKPFKDYGAIFSLEGVLVDVTGLQYQAWLQTSKIYDLSVPSLDDVKFASVHKEEFAVQRIFYWTDDIIAARKIAKTFREQRKSIFNEWKLSQFARTSNDSNDDAYDLSVKEVANTDDSNIVENNVIEIQLTAWKRTAETYGYESPTRDLLNIVGTLKPDEAVRSVFHWTNDVVLSVDIGNTYRNYLKEETSKWLSKEQIPVKTSSYTKSNSEEEPSMRLSRASGPTLEDILVLKQKAWRNTLKHGGFQFNTPSLEEIQVVEFAGLDRAIQSIFKWDVSNEIAESILKSYRKELKTLTQELLQTFETPDVLNKETAQEEDSISLDIPYFVIKEGVGKWLEALEEIEIPCAITSYMEHDLVHEILETLNLSRFFPEENRVCSDSGYDSEMQQFLGGALRLERRPDHCVVFTSTPQSAAACHEVEMKNVAIVSPYPYYELTTSDMTVRDFNAIGVRNLRNVFSEVSVEEPMEQIEVQAPQVRKQTMVKTRFWDEGDR
jgi:beta-phosphoglucomutase-like phosphatase (HAD superfamily)